MPTECGGVLYSNLNKLSFLLELNSVWTQHFKRNDFLKKFSHLKVMTWKISLHLRKILNFLNLWTPDTNNEFHEKVAISKGEDTAITIEEPQPAHEIYSLHQCLWGKSQKEIHHISSLRFKDCKYSPNDSGFLLALQKILTLSRWNDLLTDVDLLSQSTDLLCVGRGA